MDDLREAYRAGKRGGTTLAELLVVLVLLALIAAVVVPQVRARDPQPAATPLRDIAIARRWALENTAETTLIVRDSTGAIIPVTVWPDGHVSSKAIRGIDQISGLPPDSLRLQAVDSTTILRARSK